MDVYMYVCMYVYQPCYVLLFTIQVKHPLRLNLSPRHACNKSSACCQWPPDHQLKTDGDGVVIIIIYL